MNENTSVSKPKTFADLHQEAFQELQDKLSQWGTNPEDAFDVVIDGYLRGNYFPSWKYEQLGDGYNGPEYQATKKAMIQWAKECAQQGKWVKFPPYQKPIQYNIMQIMGYRGGRKRRAKKTRRASKKRKQTRRRR